MESWIFICACFSLVSVQALTALNLITCFVNKISLPTYYQVLPLFFFVHIKYFLSLKPSAFKLLQNNVTQFLCQISSFLFNTFQLNIS